MPEFAYTARDLTGQKVSGVVTAGTEREVSSILAGRDLFPLTVATEDKRVTSGRTPKVRSKFVVPFYSQLGALLKSGVPLLKSINIIREQSSNPGMRHVLDEIHNKIEEGSTLAEAMSRFPRVFTELAVSMVRAGGEGGFLEEALERIARFTEQQDELKGRVMGALAYPVFLGVVGTIIVNVLIIFFVPRFESLFERLKNRGELPWITEAIIGLSETMQQYGFLIVAGLVAIFFALKARLASDEGKAWLDRVRLHIPQAGAIYLNLAVARFCRVLGTLLNGGVPIVRSLEVSADATGNRVLADAVRDAAENISSGEALAQPLASSGHFPRNVCEMIAVAEEANTLETVLPEIAETLERQTWRRLDLFVRLLEPLMLLILAGVVLVVVIALLLPVLKMSTAL